MEDGELAAGNGEKREIRGKKAECQVVVARPNEREEHNMCNNVRMLCSSRRGAYVET
jgi:hypothetical protein